MNNIGKEYTKKVMVRAAEIGYVFIG